MATAKTCETQEPVTIADRVFNQLREAILGGKMAPGQKISEPELASGYGVSRGSLREAIGRLESSNLVERKPNVGARVITLSIEELMEIYHIREALEGTAARLAAANMKPEEIAELRKIVEMQRNEISGGNYAYFLKEVDLDFHFRIIQGSRNKRLIRLLCKDLYDLVRFYRVSFNASSPRPEQAYEEHSAIVAAMERGDGEMAELLMRHHIRASRENARQSFEAMQGGTATGQPVRHQTEQARTSAS